MKKIIVFLTAILAAVSFTSCMGTGSGINHDIAKPEVKANEAHAMTAEKAAGVYSIDTMDRIGETEKDDYKANSISLDADGTFEFHVAIGEIDKTENGTYTIDANGVIKFTGEAEDFAIVASGETVVCDGTKLTAEGKLGRSTVTMNYAKAIEE